MTDHRVNGRRGRRLLLSRWGVPVSGAVLAVALTAAGCRAPADSPPPVADATTAPPDCAPEQAALVLDPPTRQDVLTRVEVFDIQTPSSGSPHGSITLLDDQERSLTVEGLPADPEWTPWLLTRASAHHPDLVLDEDHHVGPQEPSEFPDGFDKADRYVSFLGLREIEVPFHITCGTDRHEGVIRTWDGTLSGLIACSAPQDKSEVVTRASAYCDPSRG